MAAHELKKQGRRFQLIEASARVGGMVRTVQENGYLLELGPNTVQTQPELFALIDELGLSNETLIASIKTPRYIQRKRRLRPVPLSPFALLSTKLLSFKGKLRLLKEPWVSRKVFVGDEPLQSFALRRLGFEATHHLLAPFVAGVWAGDIAALSATAAFPKLVAWEKEHGSVLRGAIKAKPKKTNAPQRPRGLLSFRNGLSTLTAALERELRDHIQLNTAPTALQRTATGWRVETPSGTIQTTNILMALPAAAAASLLKPIDGRAAVSLENIPYAPLTVYHLGFKAGDLEKKASGFGYLTLPSEKPDILGCLWTSDIFEGRAPAGNTLLTVFIGGSLNPTMAEMADRPLEDHVLNALSTVMRVKARPAFQRITRYTAAIPQYTPGHLSRMDILAEAEANNAGLYFLGNIRGGVSVGDVIRSSKTCVSRLLSADTRQTA